MSTPSSPNASASRRSRKSWNPFKSRSSNHKGSIPQAIVNQYISGGQGGTGGQGGIRGGGGGSGEAPTFNYQIKADNFTMNMVHGPNVVQGPQLVNPCPPASRIFHGRRTILDVMHQFFAQDTKKQKIYVLYGLGGAGKTQIALKFIEETTCFTDQFLLDASMTEMIQNSLKNITSQDALTWLAGKHENWLLFFDNADDPNINLNQFFPRCNHGNIIITSRNPSLRMYGGNSHVSDMEESDAVALLLNSSQQEVSTSNQLLAQDIVKALWYLPLAIVQAGAFILETGTLKTYLDLFFQSRTELLKRQSTQQHDDYAWAVYTTWEISFKRLSPVAAMFLQLCSFIHWDDISEDIFSRAANDITELHEQSHNEIATAKEFLLHFVGATGKWDSYSFLKVTNEIRAYSLLDFHPERKTFSIHPLVHSWTRTTLAEAELYHSCMDDILGWSIWEILEHDLVLASLRLVSHVDSLLGFFSTNFGLQYAKVYSGVGRYLEAKELGIIEVENQRKHNGEDHLNTLVTMNNLADTYRRLGQFEAAEKLQVEVLEKRRKLLGEDHLDTVMAMHNLAATYHHLGRFEDARKLGVEVLEKQRRLLGDDHPETLDAMHNLGITYHDLEQFEEAAKLHIVVVEKWKQLAGDDHPRTLDAMHNLAAIYHNLGCFNEAEKLKVEVLEKREKIFGVDHLETLGAMNNLGYTYYCMGHLGEAEALLIVALEKQRVLFGDNHQETRRVIMGNLINTYHGLGKQTEAAELEKLLK
ncbi:FabD/lysophospholipase-like protein [Mycena sanguinolenta]|uniref:FabD/lysophospholipase-like protein n=1 Tax=Mycena sanguinolenta TaxID=230812 RepID=A0A8H6Z923_9AGAR|nr:FabD/lysophospholipase-like protein [Mycena sanguinolenta]